ncbi:hypothetical protein F511_32094 [Dorcoceras hygrometricum]|uniref:Uncharacterized protein n=1 Tax=Dorcoceras hygrometricum TaxID=472368 RepID=A0A2Z7D6N7_9LAMI|nr:hypothetical protein F511_32094 [Dorcoceras hygrometricum]
MALSRSFLHISFSSELIFSSHLICYNHLFLFLLARFRSGLLQCQIGSALTGYVHYADLVSEITFFYSVLRNSAMLTVQSSSSMILVCYSCSLLRSGSALVSDLVQLTAAELIRLYVRPAHLN